ncbi:ribokinase, partial [Candidatus Saccharibacteria bacterium]|nr:ribokinase [Candidatus Saccharibacteria bacterium]
VETVIITDGSMGGIASNGTESYRFGIYEDQKVKDATGAGDAFGSGFLAHLAAGYSFRNSLIFASANSTSVVSKLGANRGILTGKERLHPMPIQKI